MGTGYWLVTGFDENFVRPLFRLKNYGNPKNFQISWVFQVFQSIFDNFPG